MLINLAFGKWFLIIIAREYLDVMAHIHYHAFPCFVMTESKWVVSTLIELTMYEILSSFVMNFSCTSTPAMPMISTLLRRLLSLI